jgi:GNAT superfamily N-acetyltransferase
MTVMLTTAPDFHEEHVLEDGTHVQLRHIRPEDAGELKRGFDQLSAESRYRRFFGARSSLSEQVLHYLTNVDGIQHVAIVATTHDAHSGGERGLGVARFVRLPKEPLVAEAAITVVDDYQGRGLGRLLAVTLGRAAHERGVKHFRGQILADNPPVRQLLETVHADLHEEGGGTVIFDVPLTNGDDASGGRDFTVRRLLHLAADYLVGAVRRFVPEEG